jgi:hypothetical protein
LAGVFTRVETLYPFSPLPSRACLQPQEGWVHSPV